VKSNREVFEHALSLEPAARDAWLDSADVPPAQREHVRALLQAAADPPDLTARIQRAAEREAQAIGHPERVGPYRLLDLVGEGGMGTVWRAERDDGEFRRQVAVKLIRGRASPGSIERMRRERQVLADLEHPGIARLIDGGTTPAGEPYLVMDFVDGVPLGDWLLAGPPPLAVRLRLFVAVCQAVQFAHQRLVVHCDLKPSNLMVRDDGAPVLLDFGVARIVDPGVDSGTQTFAGTPAYASPEQILGQPVGLATDVFGLGMLLAELLCGRCPRRDPDPRLLLDELPVASELSRRVLEAGADDAQARLAVPPALLRGDLDSIVRRALRGEPAQRYASALDLARDVEAFLDGRPVAARGGHWRYLLGKTLRRHRLAVASASLAVVALVALSVGLAVQNRAAREALAQAQEQGQAMRSTLDFLTGLFAEVDPSTLPGRTLSARELVDIGARDLEGMAELPDAARLELQRSFGAIYRALGDDVRALALNRAVHGRLLAAGAPPVELARIETALAMSLQRSGDFEAARRVGDEALRNAGLANDQHAAGDANLTLGLVEQSLGRLADAEARFARAADAFRALPDGAAGLAKVLHNQGQLAEFRGDGAGALARYAEAAAAKAAVLPEDHPSLLASRLGEAKALAMLGRNAEARDRLLALLPRVDRVYGADSDMAAKAFNELGSVRQDLGEFEAARAAYLEAIRIEGELGRHRIQLARVTNNLATLEEDRGDTAAAVRRFRESLAIRESLGSDALTIARARANLGRSLAESGAFDEARALLDAAERARRDGLAEGHPDRLSSLSMALGLALAQGDRTTLRARYVELAAAVEALAPGTPPRLLGNWRFNLGRAALALGDPAQARMFAEQAIDARSQALPQTHPALARARVLLGAALLADGDRAGGRALIEPAAAVLRASLVPGAPALDELRAAEAAMEAARPRPDAG
jgi:serine/threonine-protein kinase